VAAVRNSRSILSVLKNIRRGVFPWLDPEFWHRQASDGVIKIIIPTINSAHYIDLILSFYRQIELPVTVFVDSKTTDETAAIAEQHAREVIPFVNPAMRVGEMIEGVSRHCGTRWVLRIDDDELPSMRMLKFVHDIISRGESRVVGFARHQTVFDSNGNAFCSRRHDAVTHRQWRLYQPDKVIFNGRGHTPGFYFDEPDRLIAPTASFMIHLDWVVHSREERLKKLARYDAHTPGHGMAFREFYLADERPDFQEDLRALPGFTFRQIGRRLVERFPGSVVSP
jgi:glycosyltransferase involved in cell wall biosynthesis